MLHLIARFRSKEENIKSVKSLIKDFLEKIMENEPDTIYYESIQLDDNVSFIHIITFRNEEAKKLHETSLYVAEFTKKVYPLLESEPIFNHYNIVSSIKRY